MALLNIKPANLLYKTYIFTFGELSKTYNNY